MASQPQTSESDEDFHSLSTHDMDEEDDDHSVAMEPPRHPVPSMQAAFEESILESTEDDERPKSVDATAESRRQKVLESGHYDDSWTTRWKQKPGARHHPLLKLMAQIVFGMHLLQQEAAKSDEEVVKILQTHVDEVDNFLEKTMEDFDLAQRDIEERIKFLKLPMTHLDVFETMLEDKKFRTQLLDGNDKIEKIIDRTSRAMNAALLDVQKGKLATKDLGQYLDDVKEDWPQEKLDWNAIFSAMRGNEQGWKQCLRDLQKKGIALKESLGHLAAVIGEMSRIAAAVSRQQRPHSRSGSVGQASVVSAIPRSKFNAGDSRSRAPSLIDKPLPREPKVRGGAAQPTVHKQHPVPFAQRYESPRPTPPSPTRITSRSSTLPLRPKTAGSVAPRDTRSVSRSETADLANFLRESGPGPLRSNPPGEMADRASVRSASTTIIRKAHGSSAVDVVDYAKVVDGKSLAAVRAQTTGVNATQMSPVSRPSENGIQHSRTTSREKPRPSEELGKQKQNSMTGTTSFAKRLSIRRKQLQPTIDTFAPELSVTPSTSLSKHDSAQNSLAEKKSSPTDSKLKPISEQNDARLRAPSPRLGLFPTTEPLTPSAASMRTASQTEGPLPSKSTMTNGAKSSIGAPDSSPAKSSPLVERQNTTQTTETKKGRGFSLRKMFGHRKQESKSLMI